MARIELRDCTIYFQDGLSGTANLSANSANAATTLNVNTVNTTSATSTTIPKGARLTVNGEDAATIHTVTSANTVNGVTDYVTISPAMGTGNYNSGNAEGAVTILPCRLEVKIGEGNLTWSEKKEYQYLLDRGNLDTVKEGNEVPMDVALEFVYEYVKTGTDEDITPVDAVKQSGPAAEWVSSSDDECEPYCVDMVVDHIVPCGSVEDEEVTLSQFRYESLDYDLSAATISVSGKCNVSEAVVVRG